MMISRRSGMVVASSVVAALVGVFAVVRYTALVDEARSLNLGGDSVGLGVDVGELMTYGDVIGRNEGNAPVVVEEAELLTHSAGVTIAEVRLLDTDAVPSGTLIGEAVGYNPPNAAVAIPGAVMEPSDEAHRKSYQFIFSIRVTDSAGAQFYALRVRYRIGIRHYETTAPYHLRLCVPRAAACAAL